jgi:hypothetical protein
VENHTAHELHIKVTHAEHALTGFADDGKRFWQKRIERFTASQTGAELGSFGLQRFVRKRS